MKTLRAFVLIILTIFSLSAVAQAQSVLGASNASPSTSSGDAEVQRVLDQLSASGSTEQDLNALVAELNDAQIRQIFLIVLRERLIDQPIKPQSEPLFARFDSRLELVRENLLNAIKSSPRVIEVPGFLFESFNKGRGSFQIIFVMVAVLAIFALAYTAERLVDVVMRKWLARPPNGTQASRVGQVINHCNSFLTSLIRILIFGIVAIACFFAIWQGHQPTRLFVVSVTTAVLVVRLALFFSSFALQPGSTDDRLIKFESEAARTIQRALAHVFYVLAGFALLDVYLTEFSFDRDATAAINIVLGAIAIALLVRLVLIARQPISQLVKGTTEEPGLLKRGLASSWHIAALVYLGFIFFGAIFARLSESGGDDATLVKAGIVSIAIVLAVPFFTAVIKAFVDAWKETQQDSESDDEYDLKPSLVDVVYRVIRLGLIICAVVLIAQVWGIDFFDATERAVGESFSDVIFNIAITAILAYALWLVVEVTISASAVEMAEDEAEAGGEGGGAGATRLQTLLPLLRRFFQVTILVISGMIILSSIGVDIGPLIAGAGVVGLAIGFGAQKLVTDVISGLFYLVDDAFRAGEYVDVGDVKGRVESTNVRSLVLRHHRGPLHTVPYSEIKHLTNYSRDWVIVKLEFRVTYDTDVNKVKRIFKQIGQEMLEDPVIGEDFLQPFKSQGVKSMEESAMIVRGKFMSKPGKQFMIRKDIFTRVQKAFEENDIHFAHRRVAVDLPPGFDTHPQAEEIAEAAAAAAAAEDTSTQNTGA
ncbi:MAG: mechanosensitive ion channel family protein [Gammaproteobacteria bacterium]